VAWGQSFVDDGCFSAPQQIRTLGSCGSFLAWGKKPLRTGTASELRKTAPRATEDSIYRDVACECSMIFESFRRGARRPKAALLIFVLQFRNVGFAALGLDAEAVPQVP
jgi:hypothetical protein